MNVEDIASQISVIFGIQHDWRDQISGVHASPGSAETLARGGGITNHHLIAYSLSNISAKNYQNRLMCVEVIVCYISVVFFETQCSFRSETGPLTLLSAQQTSEYVMGLRRVIPGTFRREAGRCHSRQSNIDLYSPTCGSKKEKNKHAYIYSI